MVKQGTLFVVGVPIGNIEDISSRAVRVLDSCEIVACEDIGRTRRLMADLGVESSKKKLIKLFDQNETEQSQKLTHALADGVDVALISDAGTPLISDPGYELINMAHDQAIDVVPVPGPSAVAAALSISSIPIHDFRFVGFLKVRESELQTQLEELLRGPYTLVFFESRHRILATLKLIEALGAGTRPIFIARELTKTHEEAIRGSVSDVIEQITAREGVLGEIVCILSGAKSRRSDLEIDQTVQAFRGEDIKPTTVARIVAKLTGADRRQVYDRFLAEIGKRK